MKISALLIALMFSFTVNAQEGGDMSEQEAGAGHDQTMETDSAHQAEPVAKNKEAKPKKVAKKKALKKNKQKM